MNSPILQQLAQQIVAKHHDALPDLRGLTFVVPSYFVAKPLAQALSRAANCPTVLLPRLLTLHDWANSIALPQLVTADNLRIVALYQALRERNWFPDADLWSLSRELAALIDELTQHFITLPQDEFEFAEQLAEVYQLRGSLPLQFEARLIHELWYVMSASEGLYPQAAYMQKLAQLACQVDQPIYVLQSGELTKIEQDFYQRCAEHVPVTFCDLLDYAQQQPALTLLCQSLLQPELPLRVVSQLPETSELKGLRLFAANGLEQEAEAAELQIRKWLLAGKQSIAVVILDRLVARRLRALLERAQIQVEDETGWTFATLSVSTVLMRWLEAQQSQFYYQDVLDLLKSPFLLADCPIQQRKQAAFQFEQLVRKHHVTTQLHHYLSQAVQSYPELAVVLQRLKQAAACFNKKSASLSQWLTHLHQSLELLGVVPAWRADAAGQQLLQLLKQWAEELAQDHSHCSFGEWKRWLSQQLDLNTFRDHQTESPVKFTHLPATRWRQFDAVLLIGADARHLPAPAQNGRWFNDAVRSSLGLPTCAQVQLQIRDDLLGLLSLNRCVLVSWQHNQNGEPNLLSPFFELIRARHLLAWQHDLVETELLAQLNVSRIRLPAQPEPQHLSLPSPSVPVSLLPSAMSPSRYNSLMACPYQFYARYLLGLGELDEVRETVDKQDYGNWVHLILQRFHQAYPVLQDQPLDVLEHSLLEISSQVLQQAMKQSYETHAWLLRWQQRIAAYLKWQLQQEAAGWRYQSSETQFEIAVNANLSLSGRIDRIDEQLGSSEQQILDYKTSSAFRLKGKLKQAGEDVQLACYAAVLHCAQAAFVAVDEEPVCSVAPPQDLASLGQLNLQRLELLFQQLEQGAALPAHGNQDACAYCEMSGVCRKLN